MVRWDSADIDENSDRCPTHNDSQLDQNTQTYTHTQLILISHISCTTTIPTSYMYLLTTARPLLSMHADRQGVDISVTVCLFLFCFVFCVFVRTWISPLRLKLAASNFAGRFISIQGQKSPNMVNFAPPETQNRPPKRPAHHHLHNVHKDYPSAPEHMIALRVDVGSTCVDIRPSPKTDILVGSSCS